MFASVVSLSFVAAIFLAAVGIGRPIVRGLRVSMDDWLDRLVWYAVTGLVVGGMGLVVLGSFGLLHVPLIGVLTLVLAFLGVGNVLHIRQPVAADREALVADGEEAEDPTHSPWRSPSRWIRHGAATMVALVCLGSLVGALAPPTAGDALCYHLELPKAFLAEHAIVYSPDSDNSTFPLLVEMWYLWGMAVDGSVAPALIHWMLGILLALSAVLLATPILGRPWAWMVGALVILVPGINNQMATPMNDLGLALLTTMALVAWWRAAIDDQGRRWFVLAGLAAGGALGTKYLAIVFALAMGVTCLWTFVRTPRRRRLIIEGAAVVAVVAMSTGGYWYVRAAWHRGNPVYPFLSEVVSSDTGDAAPVARETLPKSKSPLGRSLTGLAVAPWQVTMHPDRFGGRGHQLGGIFLAVLPGVFLTRRLRGLSVVMVTAGAYVFFWYLLRQNVRFLFPAVPLLSVVAVWVFVESYRLTPTTRRIVTAALTMLLLAFTLAGLQRGEGCWAVAVGAESREAFLLDNEPTWRAASTLNALAKPGTHLLSQDYRAYHFKCRVTRESLYRRRTDYTAQISSSTDFSRYLQSAGFHYLLLAENLNDRGIQYDATLTDLAEAEFAAGSNALVLLDDYTFEDVDGAVRRYRLVMVR